MGEPIPCPWCGTPMEPRIVGRLGLRLVAEVVEDCAGHVAVLLCSAKECGAVSPFGLGPTKAEAVQAAEDKARRLATKQTPPAVGNEPAASRLREARERAGLSAGQAARLLSVSPDLIRSHETGQPMTTLYRAPYADLYAVSEAWLQGEDVQVDPPDGLEKLPPDEQARLMGLIKSL